MKAHCFLLGIYSPENCSHPFPTPCTPPASEECGTCLAEVLVKENKKMANGTQPLYCGTHDMLRANYSGKVSGKTKIIGGTGKITSSETTETGGSKPAMMQIH